MATRRFVTAALTVLLVLVYNMNFFAGNTFEKDASSKDNKKPRISEQAIRNYAKAIESDNKGLKTSAIYIAGVHKIEGLVNTLIKQLDKEKDEDVKVLIALSLYMIGDDDGIAAVEDWRNKIN